MIKLDITTRNYEADEKVLAYARDKIGSLERYLPRGARRVAQAQMVLEEDPNGREANHFVCEVIMTVPGGKVVSKEGTINMFAAIDIVEAKLKAQIRTYKEKQTSKPRRSKLLARILGRREETETATSGM